MAHQCYPQFPVHHLRVTLVGTWALLGPALGRASTVGPQWGRCIEWMAPGRAAVIVPTVQRGEGASHGCIPTPGRRYKAPSAQKSQQLRVLSNF